MTGIINVHSIGRVEENRKAINRPLSDRNEKILHEVADEIFTNLTGTKAPSGITRQILSYVTPNPEQVGRAVGYAAGQTYGAGICNSLISLFCSLFYPEPKAPGFFDRIMGVGANAVEIGLQVAITPMALPWITLFASGAGGCTAALTAALVTKLYHRLADSKCPPALLPTPDQLIRYDEEQQAFCDATGRPFSEQDLKDLFFMAKKYELVCQLLECNADQVGPLLGGYVQDITQKENLKEKKLKKIQHVAKKAIGRLQGHNLLGREGILPAIELISKHAAKVDNKAVFFKTQQLHDISKVFERMTHLLDIPAASPDEKYRYDEKAGKLCISGNRLSRWWNGVTTAKTAKSLETSLRQTVLSEYEKLQTACEKMQDISPEDLDAIDAKIAEMTASFNSFYEKIGHSRKGAGILPKAEALINDATAQLQAAQSKLRARVA